MILKRPSFFAPSAAGRTGLLALAFCSASVHAESFESAAPGTFTSLQSSIGMWRGGARIQEGHAKSGRKSLRLVGEGEQAVMLTLPSPAGKGAALSFHAERWTKRDPFSFRIEARDKGTWEEIYSGDEAIQTGGFPSSVKVVLPAGTRELRFLCTAPGDTGVLLDDITLQQPGPAKVSLIETVQPVVPAFIREDFNPVLGFRIVVEGSEGEVKLEGLEIGFEGTTRLADIARFQVCKGDANPGRNPGEVIAEGTRAAAKLSLSTKQSLPPGEHWFWISPLLKETASIDGRIDASLFRAKIGGKEIVPAVTSPEGSQRIGYAVRLPGDDKSKSYRIPGLARSKAGSLIAVYDIRYDHSGDLPANIDVGVSRSTDGGQSWEPMRVAIDMGDDPKFNRDGVGDPAVLVDPKSGRIFIAALWSHGNRAWNGSGPGLTPEETGQLVVVHSDDDGKSWSKPVNITPQVKDPAWRLLLNGPGAGIALKDGTLVFAAQYRAADGEPHQGKPFSTLIASKDGGQTWSIGSGVKIDTTEAQVAELADGSIMINCRDNRGGSRTVAVTKDLGKTWELHPTDRKALRESVCMASLLAGGDGTLWFSNPDTTSGRSMMTLKHSPDDGMTWPEEGDRLYDVRGGFGYSCLAPVDGKHIGVIYEGQGEMYFLRFPVDP